MTTNNINGITSVEETATDRFNKNLFEIATILLDNNVIEDEQGVADFCDGVPFLIEETRAETVKIAYGSTVRVEIKSYTLITSEGADKSYSANAIREVSVSPGSKVNPAIAYEKINKELAKFKVNI